MFEFEAKLEIEKNLATKFEFAPMQIYRDQQELEKFNQHAPLSALLKKYPPTEFFLQQDCYYNHPVWDYKQKDMALRNRKEISFRAQPSGEGWSFEHEVSLLTFKNKLVDSEFKIRQEYEFATDPQIWQVLQENGFTPAICVTKKRWLSQIRHGEFNDFSIAFDCVSGLGLYLEIEVMLEDEKRKVAQDMLMNSFLDVYHLRDFKKEDSSYLGLLIGDNDNC